MPAWTASTWRITYAAENTLDAAFAPLLPAAYGELGVNVTLTPMPFNQQWERSKGEPAGRQDMFLLLYWPTYSDAGSDNLASLFKSGEPPFFNLSYWVNEAYDALIDEAIALTGTDREAAQATYEEAHGPARRGIAGRLLLRHDVDHPGAQQHRRLRVQPQLPLLAILLPAASGRVGPSANGRASGEGHARALRTP